MKTKEHTPGDQGHAHGHGDPIVQYIFVFVALMLLTWITVWVASISFPNWDAGHVTVAMIVAGIKATLVVMIFMHAWHSGPMIKVIILTSILTLAILFAFTYADYFSRGKSSVGFESETLTIK